VSTIDRLMGRLSGEAVPARVDPEDPTAARSALVQEPDAPRAVAEPKLQEPAVSAGAPVAESVADPVAGPAGQAVADSGIAGSTQAAAGSTVPAPVAEPARPSARRSRNLEIDLKRLAARGHLVPGRGTDTMSEQYQQIKRRLLSNINNPEGGFDAPPNLIMITSSVPNEGKTFTSVNLALSLAMELERTVLAVDTDVIKQDMTRTFGASGRPGLFDYLSRDDITLPDVICNTNVPKLSLVPAGTERTTITERLASDAMRRLTLELAQRYSDRIVLFDCPPVLATTGATALAPYIGQIVVVVEAGRTTHDTLRHALQMLDHVSITGLILNKVKETMTDGYQYYGYRYGYGYLTPQGKE
jgi:protein-tyrosine kinase